MATSSDARAPKRERPRVTVGTPEVLPLPGDAPQLRGQPGFEMGSGIGIVSEQPQPEPQSRTAVLVCHGMGQQVAYETLDCVAQAIANSARVRDITVRHVRIGGKLFPRAEVTVQDAEGRPRAVHVYESYWAPLMEGRVTARDVTRFLFSAGFAGIRHALSGGFDRFMFGRKRTLPISSTTPFLLLGVFLFIVSALVLYATLGGVAVAQAGEFMFMPRDGRWNGQYLVEALAFELFRSPLAISLVVTPLMLWSAQRPTRSAGLRTGTWIARGIMTVLVVGALVALLNWSRADKVVALFSSRLPWVVAVAAAAVAFAVGCVFLARRGWLGKPVTLLGLGLVLWTVWSAAMIAERLRRWVGGTLGERWQDELSGWERTLASGADTPFYLVFLFCAVVLCLKVRWFYVQYFGDVAAYLSSHTVNKFHEVRSQIRALGLETARAVYGARSRKNPDAPEYDRVLVVGHSLGSVVAYDTLNAVLNEDATGAGLDVRDRTQALITFGSPLDRTAFIFRTLVKDAEGREALAAGAQPLVHPVDGRGRTTRWFNVYSPYDPISSALHFYDPPAGDRPPKDHVPVDNIHDKEANIPAVAHTQYWANPTLAKLLHREVTARIPRPTPADRHAGV